MDPDNYLNPWTDPVSGIATHPVTVSELARATELVADLRVAIETIATELRDEAERRDWCSDYDEFIEKVNGQLPASVPKLQFCVNDARIHYSISAPRHVIEGIETAIDQYLRLQGFEAGTEFEWD